MALMSLFAILGADDSVAELGSNTAGNGIISLRGIGMCICSLAASHLKMPKPCQSPTGRSCPIFLGKKRLRY